MARTAEYAPPQVKPTEQEPHVEEANTAEILTEQFRRELADLGFVSLFHEAYDKKDVTDGKVSGKPLSEDEKLWAQQFESTGWRETDKVSGAVLFVMLVHALNRLQQLEQEHPEDTKTGKAKVKKPDQTSSFTSTAYEPPKMTPPSPAWDAKRYVRQPKYVPFDVVKEFGKWNHNHAQREPAVKPDFVPAPSMSDAKMGPDLPRLNFNDRVRPENARPSSADFSAADRANDLLTKSLFKQGWTGGEATPEQMRAAKLDMIRNYHPDRGTDVSPENSEAFISFNSSRSHEQKAAAGEQAAREARQAAKAAEATPAAGQPRTETASSATTAPAQPKSAPAAQPALPAAPSGHTPSTS